MKANEVPEKIYRTTFYLDDDKGDTKWKKTPVAGAENIEYIRKDAFIEKAVGWIKEHKEVVETEDNGIMGWIPDYFIEEFRKYMKGEEV